MAKQFLTDEVIDHIQHGYYATHEEDLTEDQVHALSEEQLRYYHKQGKAYKASRNKKMKAFWIVGGVLFVLAIAALVVVIISMTSEPALYDPNDPANAVTEDSGTPGLLQSTPSGNTSAGAKDNGAQ